MTTLVITPTLGRSPHLAAAVASIHASGIRMRHVLVCPSSEAARLSRDCERCEVVGDDGRGVYAAIERGLRADGDWDAWTWLNDDDLWQPAGMRQVVDLMTGDPGVDLAYGRVGFLSQAGGFLGYLPVAARPSMLRRLMAAGVAALSQQGTIARRRLLEEIGPLDTQYRLAADFDWWVRVVGRGARLAFVDAHVADFRVRAGQLSQDTGAMADEMRRIVASHFGPRVSLVDRLAAGWFRAWRYREIVERYRRTGCWRTSTLLRRHGGGV
ncbi:MAG: glycosyltransferase [Opitutaceae bacterium]|nr:glycosyltransferase [Opitutaceae bacterium]